MKLEKFNYNCLKEKQKLVFHEQGNEGIFVPDNLNTIVHVTKVLSDRVIAYSQNDNETIVYTFDFEGNFTNRFNEPMGNLKVYTTKEFSNVKDEIAEMISFIINKTKSNTTNSYKSEDDKINDDDIEFLINKLKFIIE